MQVLGSFAEEQEIENQTAKKKDRHMTILFYTRNIIYRVSKAGGGGTLNSLDFNKFNISTIPRSNCPSFPFADSVRSSGTEMSGSTPWPSLNHVPSRLYILKVGTVTPPPSING